MQNKTLTRVFQTVIGLGTVTSVALLANCSLQDQGVNCRSLSGRQAIVKSGLQISPNRPLGFNSMTLYDPALDRREITLWQPNLALANRAAQELCDHGIWPGDIPREHVEAIQESMIRSPEERAPTPDV